MKRFSLSRWLSIISKEFIQLKRDRPTFGMIVGIPIIQLALFGFAINNDPKHLPTALVSGDHSAFTRSFVTALHNSQYFQFEGDITNEKNAEEAIRRGDVLFVIHIPQDFTRKLLRGERPALLLEADATDPTAIGNAAAAASTLTNSVFKKDLSRAVPALNINAAAPYSIEVHRRYNPESITQYNIVPGLMGVILTMTMIMMTGLAITREYERGTMENLLAMPVSPFEVMSGKIVPYIIIGLIQTTIILLAARFVFHIPFLGDLFLLFLIVLLFIAGNLTIGITISSIAHNQLQAMQMTFFVFLPSMMLSGFMFPFNGMPTWAQWLGNLFPLTYFLRAVRGIILKGSGWAELWPNIWPLMLFVAVIMAVGMKFYRRTLD